MFLLCGLFTPLAACAGWRDAPKKKKTARRKKKRTDRPNAKHLNNAYKDVVFKGESKTRNRKAARKERPLSLKDQSRLDGYFMGRDWPGFKMSSNIPL